MEQKKICAHESYRLDFVSQDKMMSELFYYSNSNNRLAEIF